MTERLEPSISKRDLLIDIAVVLFLMVLPSLWTALSWLFYNVQTEGISGAISSTQWNKSILSFSQDITLSFNSLRVIVPLLVLIWIRRERFATYGFTKISIFKFAKGLGRIFLTYVILCVPVAIVAQLCGIDDLAKVSEYRPAAWLYTPRGGFFGLAIYFLPCLLNSIAEELAIRSFLYVKLKSWLGSEFGSVIICSLLFASYHIYQGVIVFFYMLAFGFALSSSFRRERNIYVLIFYHTVAGMIAVAAIAFAR